MSDTGRCLETANRTHVGRLSILSEKRAAGRVLLSWTTVPSLRAPMFTIGDGWRMKPKALDFLQAIAGLEPESAYWTVDEDQKITFWSEGAEKMLGFTRAETLGRHCSAAVNCVRCSLGCGLREHGVVRAKSLEHFHKDGQTVSCRKWAQAIYDPSGAFIGGVEVLRPAEMAQARCSSGRLTDFHGILTADARFLALLTSLRHVAHSDANVLLRGETGTGKEIVARAIHQMSPRAMKPFVAINCGGLSREFLVSEIFGHKRGAFTGAIADRQGLIAKAEGGTLFLDEVAELGQDVQAMLLRVIQERRYTPLGDSRDRQADIRIISATHESLRAAVKLGRFREDLMYRLRVVPIFLPALRDRGEDIALLWAYFLDRAATHMGIKAPTTGDAVLRRLEAYAWPGNVREMINLAEYLCATHPGDQLQPEHLLAEFHETVGPTAEPAEPAPPRPPRIGRKLDRQTIEQALFRARGDIEESARALGVSRITLWRWRKKLGLL